jgi:hypothetical protein
VGAVVGLVVAGGKVGLVVAGGKVGLVVAGGAAVGLRVGAAVGLTGLTVGSVLGGAVPAAATRSLNTEEYAATAIPTIRTKTTIKTIKGVFITFSS